MPEKGKNVLVLGGTGAMGSSLVDILANHGCNVYVTSRKEHQYSRENVFYIKANAKETIYLKQILNQSYDAIVDFMSYTTDEFKERVELFLNSTQQYIFLSSARVYAPSDEPLTEESPRLLDVCTDTKYLKTDEYALAKARQENILKAHKKGNYTIVRPSLTYNNNRLQLALSEKEEWLYRALLGKSIVLPEDIMGIYTSMTWGADVAAIIGGLVGNEASYSETVHVASPHSFRWSEILEIYQSVLEEKTGKRAKVVFAPSALEMASKLSRYYQIKYARAVNRKFDSSKVQQLVNGATFTSPEVGLKLCLTEFLKHPTCSMFPARPHAYYDRIAGETTNYKELGQLRNIGKYLIFRYSPYFYFHVDS